MCNQVTNHKRQDNYFITYYCLILDPIELDEPLLLNFAIYPYLNKCLLL